MLDLKECITCYECYCRNRCDQGQINYCYALKRARTHEGVKEWLSSFNTDSATECFTAIQELRKAVEE